MIGAPEASASVTSDSVMPPTPAWMHARRHLVGAELLERADDRLDRALHVGLDDQRELLAAASVLSWLIICSSEPRMPLARAADFSRFWRAR